MEIQQLRYFLEIVRCENFTRAAEHLYVTQPMLTRAIKQLEQEFDVRLIERTSKYFRLTDAGVALYQKAQVLLENYQDLYKVIDDVKSLRIGKVCVSIPGVLLDMYFAPLLLQFRKKYPGIDISIVEEGSKSVVNTVLSSQADLGLVMLPVDDAIQLDTTVILQEHIRIMVNKSHSLANYGPVPVTALKDQPIITFGDMTTLYEQFIRLCEANGFRPHIAYKSLMPNFAADIVKSTNCVAVLPGPVIEKYLPESCTIVSLEEQFPWEIAAISRKNHYQSFATTKLLEFICEYFSSLKYNV